MGPTSELVDRIIRCVFSDLGLRTHIAVDIIENVNLAIDISGEHGMGQIPLNILHDNQTQLIRAEAHLAKRDIFGDRVILTIP